MSTCLPLVPDQQIRARIPNDIRGRPAEAGILREGLFRNMLSGSGFNEADNSTWSGR